MASRSVAVLLAFVVAASIRASSSAIAPASEATLAADDSCLADGSCAMNALQREIHSHRLAEVEVQDNFGQVESAPVYPEPTKSCNHKGLIFAGIMKGANVAINKAINKTTDGTGDITDTIYTSSTTVWKNFITKCATELNLTLTGTVSDLDTMQVTELECIETAKANTKFTVVAEVTIAELGFYGTGSSQILRTKPDEKECLVGSLPKVEGTVGATLNNITMTVLASVAGGKVTNMTDFYLTAGPVNQIKCGAPDAVDFMNKICDLFVAPIMNLFKKPIGKMLNKAINNALDKKFAPDSITEAESL